MTFEFATIIILLAWLGFTLSFVLIARRAKSSERQRDRNSLVGLAFQGAGLLAVPLLFRWPSAPLFTVSEAYGDLLQRFVNLVAVSLALGSVALTVMALRALGRQWAYAARILDDHKLIQSGPYGLVRHPIYTAMLFMNVSSALVFARWQGVVASLVLSSIGTWIRVRSEERLMHEAFGPEFTSYAASVPAIVPGLRLWSRTASKPTGRSTAAARTQ